MGAKGTVAVPSNANAIPELDVKLRAAGYDVVITPSKGSASIPYSPDEVKQLFAAVDAIVGVPNIRYSADVLRASRKLRMITSGVIGVDNIDVGAATELGILVANCPTYENMVGVAEATIMLAVATLLQLKVKESAIRTGAWRPRHTSHILAGKTFGLVGYGRIARLVEQRLQGWDVNVQAYDPYVPGTLPLEDILTTSDVVSLHVVLTPETRNMIGPRELASMKPSAVLVNTSRGGAIDEIALAAALSAGHLAGAAVDVFDQEPVNMDNPLFACDPNRLILTPHSIGHNEETGPAGVRMAIQNIECAMRGELPESVINRDVVPAWRERIAGLG